MAKVILHFDDSIPTHREILKSMPRLVRAQLSKSMHEQSRVLDELEQQLHNMGSHISQLIDYSAGKSRAGSPK